MSKKWYDDVFYFVERNGEELYLEFDMFHHGLEGFLWFIFVAGKEEKDSLLIEIIFIVLYFLLKTVGVKLFKLSLFVIVVLNLSIEIESSTLFVEGGFLLLIFMDKQVLLGKNL